MYSDKPNGSKRSRLNLEYALNIGLGFIFAAVVAAIFVMDGMLKGVKYDVADVVIPLFAIGMVEIIMWALNEMSLEEISDDKH